MVSKTLKTHRETLLEMVLILHGFPNDVSALRVEDKHSCALSSLFRSQTSDVCVTATISPSLLHCYHGDCSLSAHATCLAERLCPSPHLMPTTGPCPACRKELLWGEMVRRWRRRSKTDQMTSQS
ncbi:Structure-specific endonuclease subunit slx1 [Geodia barretti]|uniref:Structure-specific endonuclease subunit slx1 n=1 Tax=Geodia barretti TaxID=519541 RepID=A0AA35TIC8_GEOBA|nr:Structure-specific endonuclease subunit slx1 [Geodia barretti]